MSTSSISTQLGYTAQASPAVATASAANDRSRSANVEPARHETTDVTRDVKPDKATLPTLQHDMRSEKQATTDQSRTMRKTDVDWQTNSLVYRVIDSRSGQVVSQSPDEALLRLRAYAKQAATHTDAPQISGYHVMREL